MATQAELGHTAFEGGGWETEDFRRAARAPDAPVGGFQHPQDMFAPVSVTPAYSQGNEPER